MTFFSRLSDATLRPFFYARIEGIPFYFLSGTDPGWAAPTSSGHSYTIIANSLDASKGLDNVSTTISRREGRAKTTGMSLRLVDDTAETLLDLFAVSKTTGHTTELTATLDWDLANAEVTVASTSGWASSGYAYRGRETLYYGSTTGTTLGALPGDPITRGLFGSKDLKATVDSTRYMQPVEVSDYPVNWHGRYIVVYANLANQLGTALDTAYGSTHEVEIYRGVIRGLPTPSDDWSSWTIETDPIDCLLQTEIGRASPRAALLRLPGSAADQVKPYDADAMDAQSSGAMCLVDDSNNIASWTVEYYPSSADYDAGTGTPETQHFELDVTAGIYMRADLLKTLRTEIQTDTQAVWADVTPNLWEKGGKCDHQVAVFPSGPAVRVTFHWGEKNSVGPLLGCHSDIIVCSFGARVNTTGDTMPSIVVPATSDMIPFWYLDAAGQREWDAPTSGYARIGGVEIISYTSIATSDWDGIYYLTGCKRGLFGSPPTEYRVIVSEQEGDDVQAVQVEFVLGFVETSVFDIAGQLICSTGSAGHWDATYDTLAEGHALPLDPGHFDLNCLARWKERYPQEWQLRSFVIAKPRTLIDWLSAELMVLGLYVTSRYVAGVGFRVTIDEVKPALEAAGYVVPVGTSALRMPSPASWRSPDERVITVLEAKVLWDVLQEESKEPSIVIHGLERDSGAKERLTIEPIGLTWGVGEAISNLTLLGAKLFSLLGPGSDCWQLELDRSGWAIQVGDTVSVTLPGPPTRRGTRGLASRQLVVVGTSYRYYSETGALGATLTCVDERQVRRSQYGPTASVLSYAAGPPRVTIADNAYSNATDPSPAGTATTTDADWFASGDVVYVFNLSDYGNRELHTLGTRTGSVFGIDSAILIVIGADTVMTFADYDDGISATQQKYVAIASNAPSLTGGTDNSPFRYA